MKTNAIRILESLRIAHEAIEYEVSEDEIDAMSVARKIGADPDCVFKTLVARGDRTGVCVFVIPGPAELHLKKAAAASGNKAVEMIHLKELLPLTGYIRGGCSPVGMKKQYPTFIDETAQLFDAIHVSAGVRGMQVRLSPGELLGAVGGVYAELI
ncbi:MAG: Cys-tRNA(Pro) deacylase [Ignavibacteria bacterium]|nr:Cys-tRNA(Pro) deacylase [Ignavibacteria bacterium]